MPTFPTPEPITATVSTASAKVRIAASERSDTVVLVEPLDSANPADVRVAENTTVDLSAGRLDIRTKKSGDRNGSVAITIELPAGSGVSLNLAWTNVHAIGSLGHCELDVASGRVQLDRIGALRARFADGSVAIGHVAGAADIEGSVPEVRIGEVEGVVTYRGANGRVWIGHARSGIELSGASGGFDIDRADGSVTAKGADCPIRIGRLTRGHADLRNHSAGIEIGIGEDTAAAVDAKSTKGSVRNSLPGHDGESGFADKVTVYARARHGDIVIRPAVQLPPSASE